MEKLILYDLPINQPDLMQVCAMLREENPLVSPWHGFDTYNFLAYMREYELYGSRFKAFLDLNVVSNAVRLCNGQVANNSMRKTAALLAFLLISEVDLEIGLAHTEFLQKSNQELMAKNIHNFHIISSINPSVFVDIALGRKEQINPDDLPKIEFDTTPYVPEMHYNWDLHYIALLKLCHLTIDGRRSSDKFKEYIGWMWSDFMFSATCLTFSLIYLSPKPHAKMFKKQNSKKPDEVILGVKNATWDLVMAHYWVARTFDSKGTNTGWIFSTFDKSLREIARKILCDEEDEVVGEKFHRFILEYWPENKAREIENVYYSYINNSNAPSRAVKRNSNQQSFLSMVNELETQLRAEVSKRR